MPLVRSGPQLIYFAHVPKCAGSAVEEHLAARFGPLALRDSRHLARPEARRWTRTSPQHVDAASLRRLFPAEFFDIVFAVVRHPVSRVVSAWHFQLEAERTVPHGVSFAEWLEDLEDLHRTDPFRFDNHTRPMDEMIPEGAEIFHFEHDLDAIVFWLDRVTGRRDGPRAMPRTNPRGAHGRKGPAKVVPSPRDLEVIAHLYARDFARFGYVPESPAPLAPPPDLPAGAGAEPPDPGVLDRVKRWVRP